jgi:imidazolonepropionase-like amidohydrolase
MTRALSLLSLTILAYAPIACAQQPSSPLEGRFRSGRIQVEFDAENRYRFTIGDVEGLAGSLTLRGDTMTMRDDRGRVACIGVEGTYRFALASDTLRFTLIEDTCEGRRNALAQPWVRSREGELALTNATIIDGAGVEPRSGMTIVVRDGKIDELFSTGSQPLPAGIQTVDLSGRYVIPGLIDSHVHLATDPSGGDRRESVQARLAHALRGGITSVRDMAGDARALADLARAALVGDIESPRIYYSALLSGPGFFDDPRVASSSRGLVIGSAPWALAVTDSTNLELAIAAARGTGATGIKLYAEVPPHIIARIAAEAHKQGMRVWSHATLVPSVPTDAVAGGVDALSHAAQMIWQVEPLPDFRRRVNANYAGVKPDDPKLKALFAAMAEKGIALDATLWVSRSNAEALAFSAGIVRQANAAGVPILAGTDAIGAPSEGPLPHLHDELELLVKEAGLTPLQAITAATLAPARVLGIDGERGTIAAGKAADLVILRENPAADIRATRSIEAVYRDGRRYEPKR